MAWSSGLAKLLADISQSVPAALGRFDTSGSAIMPPKSSRRFVAPPPSYRVTRETHPRNRDRRPIGNDFVGARAERSAAGQPVSGVVPPRRGTPGGCVARGTAPSDALLEAPA